MVVNFATGTPKEAVNWVHYMNALLQGHFFRLT